LYTGKSGVIAFRGGYHGLTYGALAVTSRADFREPFAGQVPTFARHVPYAEPRGCLVPCGNHCTKACLRFVEEALWDERTDVGAVIVEPIQGRGGIAEPPMGWLRGLRELCDRHNVLLIADEIFTGWGRTGDWFACDHESVVPDLLCMGKAMGGGVPISACVGRPHVMAAWGESRGEALHTSTFLGWPLGCAAALAAIAEMEDRDLPGRARTVGAYFKDRLNELAARHPEAIAEVRGRGLMLGLRFTTETLPSASSTTCWRAASSSSPPGRVTCWSSSRRSSLRRSRSIGRWGRWTRRCWRRPHDRGEDMSFLEANATHGQLLRAVAANHTEWFIANARASGGEVCREGGATWIYTPKPDGGEVVIPFPRIPEARQAAVLDKILSWCRERGVRGASCWARTPHGPRGLGVRLAARGFEWGWKAHWMRWDLTNLPDNGPAPDGLRIATDDACDWDVKDLPYYDWEGAAVLRAQAAAQPRRVWHFGAWLDGKIVGQVRLHVTTGRLGVAGIYALGVVPAARKQGIGRALMLESCRLRPLARVQSCPAQLGGLRVLLPAWLGGTGIRPDLVDARTGTRRPPASAFRDRVRRGCRAGRCGGAG
jgi:GNAT superfamily N-acetyltransferase